MNYLKVYNFSACLHVFSTISLGSMEIFSFLFNDRGWLMLLIGTLMLMFGMFKICTEDSRLSYSNSLLEKWFVIFSVVMSFFMFLMALLYGVGLFF